VDDRFASPDAIGKSPVPLRPERRRKLPGMSRWPVAIAELSLNTKHHSDAAPAGREWSPAVPEAADKARADTAELLYPPTRIAGGNVVVAGLAYRSDEWDAFLEDEEVDGGTDLAAAVDPRDLREIDAAVAGRTFRLSAVDRELAMATSLAVQLGLFGPPSLKVLPPPAKQKGLTGNRARRAPERPWVHTLGCPQSRNPWR